MANLQKKSFWQQYGNLILILSGILIGVLMLRLIFVGLNMIGINQDFFYVIKGGIILFACALDMRKYLVKK